MPTTSVPLGSPDKGVVRSVPREGQPPATCFDALNVVPYDRYGRKRLAQRGGLVRQHTNPLNASATKIQGMIEAPVLAYAQAEQAIGTLTQLGNGWPGSGGFGNTWNGSTNTGGNVVDGPYSHTYSSAATTLIYDWQFALNISLTIPSYGNIATTDVGTPTQFSYLGRNRFYVNFPLTATTPNDCLILIVGFDWVAYTGINGSWSVNCAFANGDITANESAWNPCTPQQGTSYPSVNGIIASSSSGFSTTVTFDMQVLPAGGGATLTMNPQAPSTGGGTVLVYPSYSYNQWPNLNILKVEVAGANTGNAWTSAFSLVDFGTAISAVPATADFAANASFLIAACHGQVYKIDNAGNVTQATGLTNPLKVKTLVDMAFLSGVSAVTSSGLNPGVFMVDGTNFVFCDVTTSPPTLSHPTYTGSAGSFPTNCSLICNWRGRLVLAQDSANPNNVYMSRVGNPTDFDYANLDPAAAVALQLSSAGQLGEPVMALIPFSDDYLLIGCLNSLWMIQGDPADGGTVVNVSKSMGMTANNAWCVGPDGTLYFIARGGLYSVKPAWEFYRPPELISAQTYDQYFQSIIQSGRFYLSMQFDVDNHYIHIFATATNEEQTGTHMVYDVRNGGFWPQYYPHNYSPVTSTQFLGNATTGRPSIMMGGFDSVIRYWTPTKLDDDGTAISSYALLGPVKADPEAAMLSGVTIDMGEVVYASTATVAQSGQESDLPAQWNATATLFSGPDAFSVTEGAELGGALSPYYNNYSSPAITTPHSFTAITMPLDRRQKTFRQRLRGGWHSLMISNSTLDTYWSFEQATMEFMAAGRNRERR